MNPLLQQQIEALIGEKKHENKALSDGTNKEIEFMFRNCDIGVLAQHYRNVGFNDHLSYTKQSLPKIIELVRKDTIGRVKEKIENYNFYNQKFNRDILKKDLLELLTKEN